MDYNSFEPPLFLINRNGECYQFNDKDKILPFIKYRGGILGPRHVEVIFKTKNTQIPIIHYNDWIIRDSLGQVVLLSSKLKFSDRLVIKSSYWKTCYYKNKIADFSNGKPVPGTGKRLRRKHYRSPSHIRAERFSCKLGYWEEEIIFKDRFHIPPNKCDEIALLGRNDRSWKKFRKHQYKNK